MTETPDNTDPKLEALLRQWGADQAGRVAKTHLATKPPVLPPRRPAVLRWVPVAAAAVLLLAAGAVFLASRMDRPETGPEAASRDAVTPRPTSSPSDAAVQAQIRQIIAENEKLRSERNDLKAAMLKVDGKWVTAIKTHQEQIAALQKQAEQDTERLEGSLRDAAGKLKQADLALKARTKELADATGRRDKAVAELKASGQNAGRLKARVDQLTQQQVEIRAEYGVATEALVKANDKLGAELAAAKRLNERTRAEFQRLYLAAGAPGLTGLAARKATARRMRLMARGAALRRQCDDERVKALLDRVDVALTRLDMLDLDNSASVKRFTDAVAASRLATRIDDTLALGVKHPGLKTWLRETRMIFTGVGSVG